MKRLKDSGFGLVVAAALAWAGPVLAEVHQETHEHRFSADEVNELRVLNLVGAVNLKPASGNELIVRAQVSAEGRDAEQARANARLVKLDIQRRGSAVEVVTQYPVDEHDTYVYLRDNGLAGLFSFGSRTTTTYQGERVSIRSGGGGIALHTDYEVLVPAGVAIRFENKVGGIQAENIEASLNLDSASGGIRVKGGSGEVRADTGSGQVEVMNRKGDVLADTGSGSVELQDIEGNVEADTGSGSVTARNVRGEVRADTGSGSVELDGIKGNVYADTGSGRVRGSNLSDVRELEIDTGSGGAQLDGDLSKLERLHIDTGSGGVRIKTKGTLNMQLSVSTGSGGVRVDLPEMQNVRTGRGEFEARIGNGKGRGVIDTGSGGVRISSN